jgi:hypothetical protein
VMTTSKKLSDSFIFIDDKNSNIEDWLSAMRNKLKKNADWFSTETSKKTYILTRINEDSIKHLISRFKKNSIKSFLIVEEIFDNLNRMFDDFNKKVNVLKTYKRLKQVKMNKKFHTFFAEFQRLASDSKIYDETILLEDLKNKMFWDLQKTLTLNIYKVIDLYEFVRFCQFIDQTSRDVNNKSKNVNRDEYEESNSISKDNANNQESFRNQSNAFKFRFQTSTSSRVFNQASIEEQVNAFHCYRCAKSDHIARNCDNSKKFNSNSFVREMNVQEKNDHEENFEHHSKKE